ncbi:hypothetical protein SKAU_G00411580 [Synaphobranchus kaupii]|uniref:Uncharacterized protein n=1 Tax=Synaphobranchus kaupii TaxID=118154 RepID=A0A9Q1IBR9_SYNKA|nr:hypothetical protein SKAU_G00411580 [Synaphobranchus kaupii]
MGNRELRQENDELHRRWYSYNTLPKKEHQTYPYAAPYRGHTPSPPRREKIYRGLNPTIPDFIHSDP